MPRTNINQVFQNGVLISEEAVIIPDSAVEADEAPGKLRQVLASLRTWAGDARTQAEWDGMTNAQLRQRMVVLDDRIAKLSRAMAYVIRYLGETD